MPGPLRSPIDRRSFLRGAGLLAAAVAGGAGLAACGSSDGVTQLRFCHNKRETLDYMHKVTDEFNASQTQYHANMENTTNYVADFVRNTPVAIGMSNFQINFAAFINHGVLADQSDNPILQTLRPDVVEFTKLFGSYKGEVSCIPYSLGAGGVIYNRELFDKAGVKIPTTWSEFKQVCETLKSKGITPIQGTFSDIWTVQQGMFDFLIGGMTDVATFFTKLNAQGTNVGPGSEVSFSKDWVAPMKQMMELLPYFNKDAKQLAYDAGNTAFGTGQAAMIFQGPWAFTGIGIAGPKLKLGMFPLPATDKAAETKAWVNLDQLIFTPRSATGAQRDGGLAMMNFLMKPEIIHKYNADNLAFSPDKGAPQQEDPRVSDMNQYVLTGKYYQGPGYYFPNAINIGRYLQGYLYGTSTVEQFLGTLDSEWKRLAVRLAA